jgi:hypothetical protein
MRPRAETTYVGDNGFQARPLGVAGSSLLLQRSGEALQLARARFHVLVRGVQIFYRRAAAAAGRAGRELFAPTSRLDE